MIGVPLWSNSIIFVYVKYMHLVVKLTISLFIKLYLCEYS